MASKETYIHIQFKHVSMNIFPTEGVDEIAEPNVLTIHVSPLEGFSLRLNAKRVGQGTEMKKIFVCIKTTMKKRRQTALKHMNASTDCLNGDPTNFSHWDEVAQSWHFVDQIRKVWDALGRLYGYPFRLWEPLDGSKRKWRFTRSTLASISTRTALSPSVADCGNSSAFCPIRLYFPFWYCTVIS